MEATLNIPTLAATVSPAAPVLERAVTTKVAKIAAGDDTPTLPAEKPFVAQVVNARLSGADYPETAGEIAPPERTLRPYNVPMLPYDADDSKTSLLDPRQPEDDSPSAKDG